MYNTVSQKSFFHSLFLPIPFWSDPERLFEDAAEVRDIIETTFVAYLLHGEAGAAKKVTGRLQANFIETSKKSHSRLTPKKGAE